MKKSLKELYERKSQLWQQMNGIASKLKEGKELTEDESRQFDTLDKEYTSTVDSIKILERSGDRIEAPHIYRGSNEQEIYRTRSGDEIPVFNRNTPISMRAWYESRHDIPECLRNVTFGQICRAYISGARSDQEERALNEGVLSAGGFTVPTVLSAAFFDALRPKVRVLQAGAQIIPFDGTNKFSFAKLASGITASWKDENSQSTPNDQVFDQVQFTAKTLRSLVIASKELIDDSINFDQILQQDAVRSFAAEIDRAALVGSGSGSEPAGIVEYTDAAVFSMGSNGAQLTSYAPIAGLVQLLQLQNAAVDGNSAAIMSPRTLGGFNRLVSSADDQPLQRPPYFQNMPFLESTIVPINDTQGSSNAASKIFIADWSQLLIGTRLNVTIQPLRERYADYYQTGFMIAARLDIQPAHEESFGYIEGITADSLT
jgi:HK97 family phage major capsid protein